MPGILLITIAYSHSILRTNGIISVSGIKMMIMGHGVQLMLTKMEFIKVNLEIGATVARNVHIMINLKKVLISLLRN